MTTTVLLLGRTDAVVGEARQRLVTPGIEVLGGTGIDDLRSALAGSRVDHVIMGAGLDLDTRLEIIREIFQSSDTTTVHMKDDASGPEGFQPFIRAVLSGLASRQLP
ncbi:hypothetical protein AB5J56_43225 [Streptomyces sp. R21]|uniref:Response regulatory domain-containing protein n=1 Tax=Streptomyces sp. R21 TaxID=3238627 RepID=A0AB39PKV6_9ACTN